MSKLTFPIALASLLISSGTFAATGNPTAAPSAVSANAADDYRQAVKLLQTLRSSPAQRSQLDRYADQKFDARTARFFAENNEILRRTERGASLPNCDWGDSDMQTRIDADNNLGGVFDFARAHARFALSQNDRSTAVNDALTSIAFGRHVAMGHLMIDDIVAFRVEYSATEFLATMLPSLSPQALRLLPDRLDNLPRLTTGTELMKGEQAFAISHADEQGATSSVLVSGLDPFYRNVGAAMEQSPDDFAKVVNAQTAQLALNPLAGILGPSLIRFQQQLAVLAAKRAMLRSAIEICMQGESAVAGSHDPYGDGPFISKKTAGGFLLSSQLIYKGKPVTLIVGRD